MGNLKNFATPLHVSTKRDYLSRMIDDKAHCIQVARKYDKDYWDGDRRYGYGGYKYMPGRWKPVAEQLIKEYGLTSNSKVLDLGCGKGYLMYEIKLLIPNIDIIGIDSSSYALEYTKKEIKQFVYKHNIEDKLPYKSNEFDLVISLGTFHNLKLPSLMNSLFEMDRVGKQGYLMLESYRNESELCNLQCWALTAESFFDKDEWIWLYNHSGYTGDYEFIYFE
jgi:SAM-dependent methyltransferase